MRFIGLHTAGTTVPLGGLCPKNRLKSARPSLLPPQPLLLLLLIIHSYKVLALCTLPSGIPSVLTPGKHNTTPITSCTGYNPARLTFITATSGGTPPYTYQWQQNNMPVPGETQPIYDPPQINAAGFYSFNCAITDETGTVVYTDAKIIIIVPDPVVTISGGGIVCQNNMISITSYLINGTGTSAFQWESSASASGPWAPVPGATSDTYSPATSVAGTVYYHIYVNPSTGSCNDVTSSAVGVTVNPSLVITVQPASQSDCKENSIVFGAAISGGTAPVTYTWQRKKPTGSSFANIISDPDIAYPSVSTLHVDKIGSLNNPNGTQYQVLITDSCGSQVTQPATLTVNEITGITPVTQNFQICEGGSVSYKVTTSTLPLSYQWLKNGVAITNGAVYSGATTAVLTIANVTLANNGRYQVRVIFSISVPNNNGGGATSCSETSTLDRYLIVTNQPVTSTIFHN